MLFGMAALDLWITLEADPDVVMFCERPMLLPDSQPRRAVDFWIKSKQHEEFLVLQRGSENAGQADDVIASASTTIDGIAVRYIQSDQFDQNRTALTNWGWILRDLAAFSRFVPESICREALASIGSGKSIEQLQSDLPDFDSATVKLAVYLLLHRGQAVCKQLATHALEPSHLIERP